MQWKRAHTSGIVCMESNAHRCRRNAQLHHLRTVLSPRRQHSYQPERGCRCNTSHTVHHGRTHECAVAQSCLCASVDDSVESRMRTRGHANRPTATTISSCSLTWSCRSSPCFIDAPGRTRAEEAGEEETPKVQCRLEGCVHHKRNDVCAEKCLPCGTPVSGPKALILWQAQIWKNRDTKSSYRKKLKKK